MLQTSVTVLDTVPSYLARWLAEVSEMPANCRQALAASLKLVLTTGEPLMADTANSLFRTLPGVKLFNLYGQTETTGTVAIHHVSDPAVDPIAIGRIAADCGFYVLDSNLNPSQEGELFLFGPCLACGYQPGSELTANAFVPDPFGADSGRTIYRTSDRVRRLADGVLQFIGRTDRQVKFHGIRIELGEIEATLLRHPEIHEAAVVMSTGPNRDARLVAFVAICPGSGPCEDCDLRAFVAASLGAVLTPGHIVFLETLPRTEGGKIDYPALLAYEFSSSSCRPSSRPPATPAERLVAKCWEEILRVPGLGREDDFFALGGDSLQAIQMLILVQKHLSARLPLGALFFREPTIGAFAKAIDEELV
jgi:acyl-coenzyme A synthetase/AMP-(fatty) acid ligase/acyl carrier protein